MAIGQVYLNLILVVISSPVLLLMDLVQVVSSPCFLPNNQLTGTIPTYFGQILSLTVLEFQDNKFTGILPNIFKLPFLLIISFNTNWFTGSLPVSLAEAPLLASIDLSGNLFTGVLPHGIGGVLLGNMDINSNSLTGTIPSTLLSSPLLITLSLSDNSFTGTIPTELGQLRISDGLSLNNDIFSGSIPSSITGLSHLHYVAIYSNQLTGSLEFINLPDLTFVDVSYNLFVGLIPSIISDSLVNLNLGYNIITGTIPEELGSVFSLNKLSIAGTSITGSIPAEFCSTTGMSINVTDTALRCYGGCLTSSEIIIYGASDHCHDGSIMKAFYILVGVLFSIIAVGTVFSHRSQRQNTPLSESEEKDAGSDSTKSTSDTVIGWKWDELSKQCNPLILISIFKVGVVIVISLSLSDWWKLSASNAVVESCASPVGSCYSFCDSDSIIDVAFTDDDFKFDDVYVPPSLIRTSHMSSVEYCIAELLGTCAYKYWMIFKLVPLLLHLLSLALQFFMWRLCHNFTPQQKQYDVIILYFYPKLSEQVGPRTLGVGDRLANSDHIYTSSDLLVKWRCMCTELKEPQFYSIFAFLEMFTALYVWGELIFPSIYCNPVRPLSLYYYPILMSLAELIKFNLYVAMRYASIYHYADAAVALVDFEYFVLNLSVSIALAVWFSTTVCTSLCNGVVWAFMQGYYTLSGSRPNWPAVSDGKKQNEKLELSSAVNPLVSSGSTIAIVGGSSREGTNEEV